MKITTKIKAIILLLDLFLVICGILFLGSFFKKNTNISCKLNKPSDSVENETSTSDIKQTVLNELTECQNNLFKYQNESERLKLMPDVRKDIVNLLLSLHTVEKKIGQESNLSSDCIKIFSLSSRIPSLQEYTNKYRQQMFADNCIFSTNEDLVKSILPFQIKFLESQQEIENQSRKNDKWYRKYFNNIKYLISKLFVKSQIKKSELEIAIESSNYKQAKEILENIKNTQTTTKIDIDKKMEKDVYSNIHNAVVKLNNLKQMINDIYLILEEKN